MKLIEQERNELLRQFNYKRCGDCAYYERIQNKRVTLKCSLTGKIIQSARTKACDQFK